MRETADRFAKAGFLTVCPDLTWRQGNLPELEPGTDQALEEGRRRMAELTDGMRVVNEAGTVAMTQVSVTGPRVELNEFLPMLFH